MSQLTESNAATSPTAAHRVAVHVVGRSDIGFPESGRKVLAEVQARRLAELAAMGHEAREAEIAGTPLSRFVAGLRAASPQTPTDVVLLATAGDKRATEPIAAVVQEHIVPYVASVAIEIVTEPTSPAARAWTRSYAQRRQLDENTPWALHLGAGATGIFLGVLFELLMAGLPVTLRTEDDAELDVSLDPARSEQTLKRWLVRHRFYDVLAPLDPVWWPLAQRQAVDVGRLLEPDGEERTWQLDDRARAVLFDAVQAAFAEGLARKEITDGAAARTWLRRMAATAPKTWRDQILLMLGCIPGKTSPVDGSFRELVGEPLASLLRQDVVDWHEDVKKLSHGQLAAVPTPPPTVLALQHAWLRDQHAREPLVHYPVWPLVEPRPQQRRVLLLRVAGEAKDDNSQRFNDNAVDQTLAHLDAGEVSLVEFRPTAAVATAPRPGMRGPFVIEVDEADIDKRPSLTGKYRDLLNTFLLSVPDASLVDEVAVVVPAGPKALVTAAMLAAVDFSLHAAAPLRLVVLRGSHGPSGPTATTAIVEDPDRPLAALGLDAMLSKLAVDAIGNLDLTIAEQLLRQGSARLRGFADAVAALKRDTFGVPDVVPGTPGKSEQTSKAEILLACARLRLCGTLASPYPWDAAYLASSVLDHTFRMPQHPIAGGCDVAGVGRTVLTESSGWVVGSPSAKSMAMRNPSHWVYLAPWQNARRSAEGTSPSLSELRTWRNDHPLSHGIDQPWESRFKKWDERRERITVPKDDRVAELIEAAEVELREALTTTYSWFGGEEPDPATLVRRHADLMNHPAGVGDESQQ